MRGIKRVVAVFSTLVVVLVVLAFVLENQQGVSLSFLGLSTEQLPVSVYLVVALILGMLVGPVLGAVIRLRRS
ncbi:LapA family protein [Pseudomonas fluorescens]|uniref:lipopolysaccharide assembly protein LapA domain-containing protein n=1 Tax=Pseudomonas TaxID=286 RepID=UPI000DD39830|nr:MULTISPECIES: lipopolysaccharide assembly protein LapA domain-containing protein [Pseudomonas]MBD8192866.1 LapA family protein [Pseudomonas fluorescens]MBD8227688.1 LapA family protein [Pseudomonas fluorescens]MBD8785654.1 LapA family protein [Pseudomonas fluorescens]MBD8817883.1 LapA family protein [Pseudomonas fluorescens]MCM2362038.1 lipopolysaccharide assembly protein LapA domain-containing protein [Pseudomonas sp. SR18]